MEKKVTVLVVDDSFVARNLLGMIFGTDPGIEVIGTAPDGNTGLNFLKHHIPDVITMDINMPGMDGFETTAAVLKQYAIPIVIVSGNYSSSETAQSFRALEAGAVAILPKPPGPGSPDFEKSVKKFCSTIKAMSEVRVVRRTHLRVDGAGAVAAPPVPCIGVPLLLPHQPVTMIAIGASAGGPEALVELFRRMDGRLPVPVLLVQHIDAGFASGFAEWLTSRTGIPVSISNNGDTPVAGRIHMAPGNHHLSVGRDKRIRVTQEPPEGGLRPSVSFLFRSVRQVYGRNALGILLSGMGRDGAVELKSMKDAGSITIAQDEKSSLVFGMPGEACRIGAVCHLLPSGKIAETLLNYLHT